jgi:glycosyltransferase involved in cell wall biosynthesis
VYVIPWKSTLDTNIKIPSKLVEAMAMGKPVVASRLKSLETLFRDGRDIMFFNPNDSKDLAEKVSLLLKDSKLRRKLGRRAKELSKQFSWSVLMKRELNFLKRMGIIKT